MKRRHDQPREEPPQDPPRVGARYYVLGSILVTLFRRAEIVWTVVMDLGMLVGVLYARKVALGWITALQAADAHNWSTRAVELVADFGMVGTVLIITVFDLLKRIQSAWQDFRKEPGR